jgi:hypothetical protein
MESAATATASLATRTTARLMGAEPRAAMPGEKRVFTFSSVGARGDIARSAGGCESPAPGEQRLGRVKVPS